MVRIDCHGCHRLRAVDLDVRAGGLDPGFRRQRDATAAAVLKFHLYDRGHDQLIAIDDADQRSVLPATLGRVAPSTARSRLQLLKYQPRQNQDKSSPPALSMARKKSEAKDGGKSSHG